MARGEHVGDLSPKPSLVFFTNEQGELGYLII